MNSQLIIIMATAKIFSPFVFSAMLPKPMLVRLVMVKYIDVMQTESLLGPPSQRPDPEVLNWYGVLTDSPSKNNQPLSLHCWCSCQSPHSLQCCTRCRPASALRDQRCRLKEPAWQHHAQYSGPVFWPHGPSEDGQL